MLDHKKGINSIYFFTNKKVQTGNILQDNKTKFLVVNAEFDNNTIYHKLYLQEMNYIIQVGKSPNNLIKVQGILDTRSFEVSHENTISTLNNFFLFTCPKNEYTYSIDYDTKVIALRDLYKIIGIDSSINGLITFTCEKVQRDNEYDYTEVFDLSPAPEEPSNPSQPEEPPILNDVYSITITGKSTLTVNQTSTYNATVHKNGTEIMDKPVIWSLNNDKCSLVEYTDLNCRCRAMKTGYCMLRATLKDDSNIFTEFKIGNRLL